MENTNNNEDLTIEIDSEIYERLVFLGLKLGRDDVTEFINDMLYSELKLMYFRSKQQEENTR